MKICIYTLDIILVLAVVGVRYQHLPGIPRRLTVALVEMGCYRKPQWIGKVWLT